MPSGNVFRSTSAGWQAFRVLFSLLLVTAFPSMAGPITSYGGAPSERTHFPSTAGETIIWSQLPTGYGYSSQYFLDMYPEYDSGVASDFQFDTYESFNIVRWWGEYWNSSLWPPLDAAVEVYIYEDDGTGNAPTLPQHSSAIRYYSYTSEYYSEVEDGEYWKYECELYDHFTCLPGQKYWIEIRRVMEFDPYGQWGWSSSEPVVMSPLVQGFDGLGIEWWTPQDADAAFLLVYVPPPALERTTWADIKTTF